MLRVVQVVPKLNVGGLQKVCVGLSNTLVERGVGVSVISLSCVEASDSLIDELHSDVSYYDLSRNQSKIDFGLFFRLNNQIRKLSPDVVHSHGISLFYLFVHIIFNPRVKFVHTIHNVANRDGGFIRRKIQSVLFRYFRVRSIALSSQVESSFVKYYGYDPFAIIPNAATAVGLSNKFNEVSIEVNGYKVNDGSIVLVSVGRICAQKNQSLLVSAVKRLCSNGHNVVLIVLGGASGPAENKLYSELIFSAQGYPIHFLGSKNNVGDYLLNSDVFCLSSEFEGFPISILEAFSCGLPVVSTRVGGISDILLSPGLGLLSVDKTIDQYSNTLVSCLNSLDSFDSEYIRDVYSDKYTYSSIVDSYLKAYTL